MIERLRAWLARWQYDQQAVRRQPDGRERREVRQQQRQIVARAEALGISVDVRTRRYRHADDCQHH